MKTCAIMSAGRAGTGVPLVLLVMPVAVGARLIVLIAPDSWRRSSWGRARMVVAPLACIFCWNEIV